MVSGAPARIAGDWGPGPAGAGAPRGAGWAARVSIIHRGRQDANRVCNVGPGVYIADMRTSHIAAPLPEAEQAAALERAAEHMAAAEALAEAEPTEATA